MAAPFSSSMGPKVCLGLHSARGELEIMLGYAEGKRRVVGPGLGDVGLALAFGLQSVQLGVELLRLELDLPLEPREEGVGDERLLQILPQIERRRCAQSWLKCLDGARSKEGQVAPRSKCHLSAMALTAG